jgi:hypothetical protein
MWGMTGGRRSRRGDLVRRGSAAALAVLALATLASLGSAGAKKLGVLQYNYQYCTTPSQYQYCSTSTSAALVHVSRRELKARVPIRQLSADGDRVAYWLCPHRFGAWRPGDAPVALGSGTDADCLAWDPLDPLQWEPFDPAHNVYALTLAGDRLAYLTVTGINYSWGLLWVTTLERGDEGVTIASGFWIKSDFSLQGLHSSGTSSAAGRRSSTASGASHPRPTSSITRRFGGSTA